MIPTRFDMLPTATWPRLRTLLDCHAPGGDVINTIEIPIDDLSISLKLIFFSNALSM